MERISVRDEPRGGASSKVMAERACRLCLGDGRGVPVLKVGLRRGVVGSRLQRWAGHVARSLGRCGFGTWFRFGGCWWGPL